jgi:hypothetical protein
MSVDLKIFDLNTFSAYYTKRTNGQSFYSIFISLSFENIIILQTDQQSRPNIGSDGILAWAPVEMGPQRCPIFFYLI